MPGKIFKDTNNPATAFKRYGQERKARDRSIYNLARLRYKKEFGKSYDTMDKSMTVKDMKQFKDLWKRVRKEVLG